MRLYLDSVDGELVLLPTLVVSTHGPYIGNSRRYTYLELCFLRWSVGITWSTK